MYLYFIDMYEGPCWYPCLSLVLRRRVVVFYLLCCISNVLNLILGSLFLLFIFLFVLFSRYEVRGFHHRLIALMNLLMHLMITAAIVHVTAVIIVFRYLTSIIFLSTQLCSIHAMCFFLYQDFDSFILNLLLGIMLIQICSCFTSPILLLFGFCSFCPFLRPFIIPLE